MKKLYFFFALLLSLFGGNRALALDLPTGILNLGDAATTLETGKWYFLYNQGTGKYIQESASGALNQVGSPSGKDASAGAGYLVTLEEATDGKYYIKTGLGNYYKGPGSSARGTGATATGSWAMTISPITGTTSHFTLQGTTYNMIAPSDGSDIKGGTAKTAGSIGDWVFYNVAISNADELTGRDLYNYQMSRMGLIRLHNKRTATSYLTTNTSGSAVGAGKVSSGLSQVWILEKEGSGYTVRSANTGQYLQSTFGTPAGGATTLYIQFSPNNTGTMAYINISSASDFSGMTCMNLGNNGTTVTKWSYSNDAGSDWAIELVDDVTEDEVRAHMNAERGYASELNSGSYYRLVSTNYGRIATESDGIVRSIAQDNTNYSQYWKLVKSGNGYTFQNVVSEKYIQRQGSTSSAYQMGNSAQVLYPRRTSDKWEYKWVISNTSGGTQGMHTASSQNYNVVLWSTDADASVWAFQEVTLTDEEIEAARGAKKEFDELVKNLSNYQAHLDNLFADKACTTLKDDIQALTDAQLAANEDFAALNADIQAMILKVKNNTWQQFTNTKTGYTADYERFFRIADYQIYSNYIDMANGSNFTMSNNFGRLSGPTGIVANPGDIVYIYVDADPKAECQLKLEAVGTDGVAGNHSTGTQSDLHKGLNVYSPAQQMMLYIFHQLDNTKKYLADYPDIKIHIEGGQLNGYWDATRGMTNADWALLQQDLLKAPFVNLKTKHLVFQMDTELVTAAEPTEMEGLMRIWEMIPTTEDSYMGVEDFEGRYNNIWNVFSGASSYMHSSTFGTWYTESTIPTVMNYHNMRQPGNIWGPSHEIGHNHQGSINIVGTTESSNNLFSNINRFEQGIQTSRRQLPCDVFSDQAKNIPWPQRNIWQTTGMFFQLYLYFHAMHHDDQFYPNLFRAMRKDPFNKWSSWDSTTQFEDGGEMKTGAYTTLGSKDYLHLAKKICDVAQADLSEFFEAYGMFIPVNKYHINDYSNYLVTTTQADIDEAKKYMQKYPKKLGNIMFIDDHIAPMKAADPNNKFEGQPNSSGKRVNDTAQHDELGNGYPVGDAGDYEDYDGRTNYEVSGDYFSISGSTISFKGSGYMGHKFYDKDGNLIWATNAKSCTLPTAIRQLGVDNYTVVAAEANMKDVPCPYYKSGTSPVYRVTVNFGNEEENKVWWAGTKTELASYMPENAIGVVGSNNPSDNVITTPNVINEGTATSIVLNGDLPAYIPAEAQAKSISFKKTIDGMAALNLPFDVTSSDIAGLKTASYENDVLSVAAAESVAAGKPVVVSGNVNITLSDATLHSGDFQELSLVKVLAADGQSVVEVATASPFTYNMGEATAIRLIENGQSATSDTNNVFDLQGRRIQQPTKAGIYIVNGKKTIIK
ncbi:MAG: M60 family metallopeptidase [Bacteroidaceae bacterium]|nr:M60 family metallopeptidase [Bacteroidaceae bacterium]